MFRKAFTLMELMVVIVILGVLCTIAIVNMSGSREKAYDKEACANLKMIAAAEKMYRLETSNYVPCADLAAINRDLRLSIASSNNWRYSVSLSGVNCFHAGATRQGNDGRIWNIDCNMDEPSLIVAMPAG